MENNAYQSLNDIRQRKNKLEGEIASQEKSMKQLWNNLFHTGNARTVPTPSRRVQNLFTTGAGILDGALLGWKLYRKFNKKK